MKREMRGLIPPLAALAALIAACAVGPAPVPPSPAPPMDRANLARRVREEFLHSWKAYERLAVGTRRAASRSAERVRDWYAESAADDPRRRARHAAPHGPRRGGRAGAGELIVEQLSFDRDISVKNFEITIRLLGGLLSAHQMTGDPRLLALADRPRHAAPARVRFADGHAVHVREPEDGKDERRAQSTPRRSARSSSSSERCRS